MKRERSSVGSVEGYGKSTSGRRVPCRKQVIGGKKAKVECRV